ncbi:nickel pincer cofactor biosynthesis protein LarB [Adlercreutzia sp. ZJ304]|uniref:nickel pincer cofactor biosynthesis protein LarB n=1 Tax=Adlercreutzia sp. ZJ304 TaxID=2709791 RepID=UPI0019807CC6
MLMNETKQILQAVQAGTLSVDDALHRLKVKPYEDLGFAKVDLHRPIQQGTSEVIYGAGKTPQQIIEIVQALQNSGQDRILITRMDAQKADAVCAAVPLNYDEVSSVGRVGSIPKPSGIGTVLVATGGTSDIPVAEEAALTAEFLGNKVQRAYDMGVAGLHRMLANMDAITDAAVIIAVAGMEGALASVVGGLADSPVIAVPTSVGYGAAFDGMAALLSMLNSCASGVAVVNIDNGFGAGYMASMINHMEVRNTQAQNMEV